MLTISPIDSIICGESSEEIRIKVNNQGTYRFQLTYYKDSKVDYFEEVDQDFMCMKGEELSFPIDKSYDSVYIEIFIDDDYNGEVILDLPKNDIAQDIEVLVSDGSLFENVDFKYIYTDGKNPSEIINLGNKYKFKQFEIMPKIIELDKLKIEIDEYMDKDYLDSYLLLNRGLKYSDFNKQEEDFYKVPLSISIVDNIMNFSLKEDAYYDFNAGAMKNKKSNNSVKVNDIILSKNDSYLTEGYLVIEKFGFNQKRFQLDLLLDEKPLFGKNGYYEIKKRS